MSLAEMKAFWADLSTVGPYFFWPTVIYVVGQIFVVGIRLYWQSQLEKGRQQTAIDLAAHAAQVTGPLRITVAEKVVIERDAAQPSEQTVSEGCARGTSPSASGTPSAPQQQPKPKK